MRYQAAPHPGAGLSLAPVDLYAIHLRLKPGLELHIGH